MNESKFWKTYLKPTLRIGFRIETATKLGVPDVFGVLPSGKPIWIENKVARSGKEALEICGLLRSGQSVFRDDYNQFIPCVLLCALDTVHTRSLIIDLNGEKHSITVTAPFPKDSWRTMTRQMILDIDKELKHVKRPKANRVQQARRDTDTQAKQPPARPERNRRRAKDVPGNAYTGRDAVFADSEAYTEQRHRAGNQAEI